jgi:hypothetical protein
VQPFVCRVQANRRRRVLRVNRLVEGLDGGPVDDAVRRRAGAPPARPEATQQGGGRDVRAHQADATEDFGQVEVGGADHLDALDVHELVVEHVASEVNLAGAAHDVAQVEAGRPQRHLGVADPVDGRRGHEREAAADTYHEPADRRVHLSVRPARHDVFEAADVLALLVAYRTPEQPGQRHDGVEDTLLRQDASCTASSLVRQAFGIAAPPGQQPGPARIVRRRWRCHGVPPLRSSGGSVGSDSRTRDMRPAVQQPAPVSHAVPTMRTPGTLTSASEVGSVPAGGRCAGGTTGGFAPVHGRTSFTVAPVRGI